MTIAVPREIRDGIQQKIWAKADELSWMRISDLERATWYEHWSKEKEVGGVLSHFMDARKVRVYIKDSLLKPYLRSRMQDGWEKAVLALGMSTEKVAIKKTYSQPHGRQLLDGRIVCWGSSRDWKLVLISVFERAYRLDSAVPYGAVLVESGKTTNEGLREMISEVGRKLGLSKVAWID